MMFSSASQEVVLDPFDRDHRMNMCSETTHFFEQAIYQVLPDDFHIEINFEGNPLSEIFDKITHILSLIYLSSSASLNHETLELQVTGQRTLEFQCQCATATPNPELYKIYNWIYTGGNPTDKAVLFGSVIYLVICLFETKYKMRKVYDSYTALKKNYSSVLTPDDINLAFDEDRLMTEMSNEVTKGMCRYACLWGIFILVSFLAIEIVSSEPFAWPLLQKLFSMIKNILTIPASNSLST